MMTSRIVSKPIYDDINIILKTPVRY
jgi:hypothetical protein